MRKTWSFSSSSVKSSNSQKVKGLFRRRKKKKEPSRSPTPDLEPLPSSLPVLPPEIHHRILEFLSVERLFYTRAVNRWYHEACLEHINRRYKKSSALISVAFCRLATHKRSDPFPFTPSPEPGNHMLKWSSQNLTLNEPICRGYIWIIFPGDEVRGTMIRFADCNEKVRKKFIANRIQKMTSWESQELLQYRRLNIEGYYQRDVMLNTPKDGREKAGLKCFENTWNWELYMPLYKLLAVKGF